LSTISCNNGSVGTVLRNIFNCAAVPFVVWCERFTCYYVTCTQFFLNTPGDWLVTLSWCLLCGWNSPIPYFQAIYFLSLLIHR
jgi:hypothetical protein